MSAPPSPSPLRSRLTSIAVAGGLLMEFIDSTSLATALPTLSREFGIPPEELKLALTTYVLALAMFIPASGWLSDRFGARRVYMIAIGIFMAGSLACALSANLAMLVAARFLQGLGGALMLPVARTIIVRSTPRENLVSAMAWFTIPGLLGPLIGPPLSGFILSIANWHWIFLINLPVSVLAIIAIRLLVPETAEDRNVRTFDMQGFVLTASAMILFIGAIELSGVGLPLYFSIGAVAGALLLMAGYVRHALRRERPVLNLQLFRYTTFRLSMIAGTVVRLGFGAGPLLMPLYFQIGLGWSPLAAGGIIIGHSIGVILAKPFAPRVIGWLGFRNALIACNLAASVAAFFPYLFSNATPLLLMYAVLITGGLSRSMQFTANNSLAYSELDDAEVSDAATMASVLQQLGLAMGVSLGGLLIHLGRETSGGALTASSFLMPFAAVSILMAAASLIYMRLPRDAGEAMRGAAA